MRTITKTRSEVFEIMFCVFKLPLVLRSYRKNKGKVGFKVQKQLGCKCRSIFHSVAVYLGSMLKSLFVSFLFSFKKTETLFSGLVKLLLNDHSQVIILVMNVSVDSYFEKWNLLFINVFLSRKV